MIKSYTDINQSRKLAEILPLESADMYYDEIIDKVTGELFIPDNGSTIMVGKGLGGSIAAWSLAALLRVLPDYTLQTDADGTVFVVCESKKPMISDAYDNPVDACVEMILKLHELNLI